jgi:hypothetical protein
MIFQGKGNSKESDRRVTVDDVRHLVELVKDLLNLGTTLLEQFERFYPSASDDDEKSLTYQILEALNGSYDWLACAEGDLLELQSNMEAESVGED